MAAKKVTTTAKATKVDAKSICDTIANWPEYKVGKALTPDVVKEHCKGGQFEKWSVECWALAAMIVAFKMTNNYVDADGKRQPSSPTSRQVAHWLGVDLSDGWDEYNERVGDFKKLGVFHEFVTQKPQNGRGGRRVYCLSGAGRGQAVIGKSGVVAKFAAIGA